MLYDQYFDQDLNLYQMDLQLKAKNKVYGWRKIWTWSYIPNVDFFLYFVSIFSWPLSDNHQFWRLQHYFDNQIHAQINGRKQPNHTRKNAFQNFATFDVKTCPVFHVSSLKNGKHSLINLQSSENEAKNSLLAETQLFVLSSEFIFQDLKIYSWV